MLIERNGIDEQLLGDPVPLPVPANTAIGTVQLDYTHFTMLMRPDWRLVAVTGVGANGRLLFDLDQSGIDWRLNSGCPSTPKLARSRNTIGTQAGGSPQQARTSVRRRAERLAL